LTAMFRLEFLPRSFYKDWPVCCCNGESMDFRDVLRRGCFRVNLESTTKQGVIEEMVDMLLAAGHVKDREAVIQAVLEREEKMSTGIHDGVALPHGKTTAVDELATAFALKKEGVDFGSMDGKPSTIFVMTISNVLRTGPHLQYLSGICRLLNVPSVRERLLKAATVESIIAILCDE
jgi:fructose-specific phosphotransferase system IIA component